MDRIELVAGDFGSGTAWYEAGEFRFPKGRLQSVAHVTSIEANTTVIQKHWGRALLSGAKNAAGLAPLAMVVGLFAAPLAAVGAIGIGAAAIGGALGLLGGGAETKALVQITFEQGTGLVGVCEFALVEKIRSDVELMRAHAERERKRLEPTPRKWFSRAPAETSVPPPTVAALPPPTPEETVEQTTLLGSVGDSLASATTSATAAVSNAADATGQALSGALAFAKRAARITEK